MIIVFSGSGTEASMVLANSMRNSAINLKEGALIVSEAQFAAFGPSEKGNKDVVDPKYMLEKLMDGEAFPAVVPDNWQDAIKWKSNPKIMLVGSAEGALDVFEEMLPGFAEKFGPVSKMSMS